MLPGYRHKVLHQKSMKRQACKAEYFDVTKNRESTLKQGIALASAELQKGLLPGKCCLKIISPPVALFLAGVYKWWSGRDDGSGVQRSY